MNPQPVMWTNDIRIEVKVHRRYRKHDSISDHNEKITSKKAQPGGRGHSSVDSSGKEADNYEGSSSSRANSHSQRKGKTLKHSKTHGPEEFKKAKSHSFDGEIK
jgi:hypothetical protein